METKFQNTFIPKVALDNPNAGAPKPASFLTFIAMIIFIISCVLAGGVFLWQQYLSGKVDSYNQSLSTNKGLFEPTTIEQYSRLNSRFDNARKLLEKHSSFSAFFDLLNKDTLKNIQFSDLKYTGDVGSPISIKMSGKAKSYNSVAYQAKVFSSEPAFKNAVFSNLDLDQSGNVIFEFDTQLDPSLITYKNNLAAYKNLPTNRSTSSSTASALIFPDTTSTSSSATSTGLANTNVKSTKK